LRSVCSKWVSTGPPSSWSNASDLTEQQLHAACRPNILRSLSAA
jgi:hypothetical protein